MAGQFRSGHESCHQADGRTLDIAFAAGDLDRAIEYWEQTRSIDPDDPRARGYLARAQEQLTRIREIRSTQG